MKFTVIRASAGCTIPHPFESYSNFKLFVELSAELKAGEDHVAATTKLQDAVNALLSTEKAKRIEDLERQHAEAEARRRAEHEKQQAIYKAESDIREAQRKLERLRSDGSTGGSGNTDDDTPF